MAKFAAGNSLLFIPSVGPGYIDTRIRPWNNSTTRDRANGRYYQKMFHAAIAVKPEIISITSYNEWHEGTQIEPAAPKNIKGFTYVDYSPLSPTAYLDLTAELVENFERLKK
jgi:glycoprotein endo-alpha-1,2-mannosidase